MKHILWVVLLSALVACNGPLAPSSLHTNETTATSPTSISIGQEPTAPPSSPVPTSRPSPTPTATWAAYADDLREPSQIEAQRFPKYDLTLTLLDPDEGLFEGRACIQYVNDAAAPVPDLVLRLYPNTPGYGGSLEIQRLSLNGAPVESALEMEGTAARVLLPQALAPDQAASIVADYQLKVPYRNPAGYGALNREGDVMTLGGFYPTLAVRQADGWKADLVTGVGDPLYAETAFFSVTVTVPSYVVVVTSGRAVGRETRENGMEISRFVGGPIRDFALVLGRDYTLTADTVNDVLIRFVSYTRDGQASAQQILEYTQDALLTYERLFGPYPYTELDMIQSPISASGLEAPGAVQLGAKALNQGDQWLELVVAHEVAHQWWYGIVGNDPVNAAWLDEGLASYSSILYFREIYGVDRAEALMSYYYQQPYYAQSASYQRMPANLPVTSYDSNNYGPVVYIHATNFFHDLHQALGEEDFLDLMHRFLAAYHYRIADGGDFISMAKTFDATEVEALYDHWISGRP